MPGLAQVWFFFSIFTCFVACIQFLSWLRVCREALKPALLKTGSRFQQCRLALSPARKQDHFLNWFIFYIV
jgi:hypothetical protein